MASQTITDRMRAEAVDLFCAVKDFLDAPRQEHLAVRLNDEEMQAVDKMRRVMARITNPESKGGK